LAAIVVDDLHYAYPPLLPGQDPVSVLRGVDLVVETGEFLGIMGPTGVGKSTLCMAMNGLVPRSTGGVIRGRVDVLGRSARSVPVAQLAAHVGMVYQDPESQLVATSVEDEVAFGPENLGVDPAEIAERVDWALNVVGLAGLRRRPPMRLSGGQKQRLAIAATLAMLPDVLILDEPTANLDPVGQHEVLAVIAALRRRRHMTIVMVSQDAERLAEYADRVAVMWAGRIARVDAPERLYADADLLARTGIAAPQVAEVAAELNRRHGTVHRFVCLDDAVAGLRSELANGTGGRCNR
jgi:energy-coupling factor transporter ATP-binding protein EcfA2